MEADIHQAISALRKKIEGDVFSAYESRIPYSYDESIFKMCPLFAVAPKSEDDLKAIIEFAHQHELPVSARGGGTGIAGQSIGSGIVIDFKKYLNKVLDITKDHVLVQPGVTLKDLNLALAQYQRKFAPDPGSYMNCTIGGMVSTNASGPHGFKYGSTRDHILGLRVMCADGVAIHTSRMEVWFANMVSLIKKQKAMIESHTPLVRKNSSGYALLELCSDQPSFERFLVGTEGTLALVTEIFARSSPIPTKTILNIIGFDDMASALDAASEYRALGPSAIELLDDHILNALEKANGGILESLGLGQSKASLWVEWEDDEPQNKYLNGLVLRDDSGRSNLWALRSRASRIIHEQATNRQPLRCIEDTVVPVQYLKDYVNDLQQALVKHDCDGPIFGHVGDGHLHVNPNIDVLKPDLWKRIKALMDDVYTLVWQYGGSISGEHGDGMLRAPYIQRQWGPVTELFEIVKNTFDPKRILNPGKKLTQDSFVDPPLKIFE